MGVELPIAEAMADLLAGALPLSEAVDAPDEPQTHIGIEEK